MADGGLTYTFPAPWGYAIMGEFEDWRAVLAAPENERAAYAIAAALLPPESEPE